MSTEARFADALAEKNQPQAVFTALEKLAEETVGARLFTLLTFDHEKGLACRVYSNMPEQYPVSGTKQVTPNSWTKKVLDGGETFVANSIEEMALVFDDHELIASLGLGSVLNVPAVVAGQVIGSINCLEGKGHYTTEKVAQAACLRTPGAVCFMLERMCRK